MRGRSGRNVSGSTECAGPFSAPRGVCLELVCRSRTKDPRNTSKQRTLHIYNQEECIRVPEYITPLSCQAESADRQQRTWRRRPRPHPRKLSTQTADSSSCMRACRDCRLPRPASPFFSMASVTRAQAASKACRTDCCGTPETCYNTSSKQMARTTRNTIVRTDLIHNQLVSNSRLSWVLGWLPD